MFMSGSKKVFEDMMNMLGSDKIVKDFYVFYTGNFALQDQGENH